MTTSFWKQKLQSTPSVPGVYIMRDASDKIIYIGKAKNLKKRIYSYFRNNNGRKEVSIANTVKTIDYVLSASEREALIIERQLINRFKPFFNSMWKDDKSYPFIKLTTNEDFPRLLLVRRRVKDGGEYYGPYPHVMQIKRLLGWLTGIFRLRPCRMAFRAEALPSEKKVKSCLYLHTGKCPGPCAGSIGVEAYRKRVKEVSLFLRARFMDLKTVWQKEMEKASSAQEYEKAADLRDRLGALEQMQERVVIRELKSEDLVLSLRETDALKELKETLGLKKWPIGIEGFDISNISGTLAVGSMVCFRNGKPDKSSYRRYKIKTVVGSNDFAMLKEVVGRRYRRLIAENKGFPDLILIDGGRGQLSTAVAVLKSLGLYESIPVISLAKREEVVYTPDAEKPIKLPRRSPALRLLQQVRDESHRFALSYHQKLRKSKVLFNKE